MHGGGVSGGVEWVEGVEGVVRCGRASCAGGVWRGGFGGGGRVGGKGVDVRSTGVPKNGHLKKEKR